MGQPEQDKREAVEELQGLLKPGDVVYTVLRGVSRSGMSRDISLKTIRNNEVVGITGRTMTVLGLPPGKRDGLRVRGCGMDMGFHLVYELSRVLFPKGFICTGRKRLCPSNDHTNGDRNFRPHRHSDGGYALVQRWL
jgi:hypothetical protein